MQSGSRTYQISRWLSNISASTLEVERWSTSCRRACSYRQSTWKPREWRYIGLVTHLRLRCGMSLATSRLKGRWREATGFGRSRSGVDSSVTQPCGNLIVRSRHQRRDHGRIVSTDTLSLSLKLSNYEHASLSFRWYVSIRLEYDREKWKDDTNTIKMFISAYIFTSLFFHLKYFFFLFLFRFSWYVICDVSNATFLLFFRNLE